MIDGNYSDPVPDRADMPSWPPPGSLNYRVDGRWWVFTGIWTHPAPTAPAAEDKHDRDRPKPEWVPGKAKSSEPISAGSEIGKPSWSERVRKHRQGDTSLGHVTETVLEDWELEETTPRVWAERRAKD